MKDDDSLKSGNYNHASSFSNDEKKQERKEAVEKVGQVAARGTADYFTGGAYEKVRNIPVVGDAAKGAEKVVGKAANVVNATSLGTLGRAADKLNKVGAIDAADRAVGALGGNMKGSSSSNTPINNNTLKNTNPNPDAFSHQKSLDSDISTNKTSLDKKGIGSFLGGLGSNRNKDTEEVKEEVIEDKNVIKNVNPLVKIGCIILLPLIFIMSIPIIFYAGGSPTTQVESNLDCKYNSIGICVEENSTIFNKVRNLLKYGTFGSNGETISNKVTEVYENILNEYEVAIDLPLLISTLTLDLDKESNENNVDLNEITLDRLEYIEDLAFMQLEISDIVYLCNSKEVDGITYYYGTPVSDNVDSSTVKYGKCNLFKVGNYYKKTEAIYNEEEYFNKLKESDYIEEFFPVYINDKDELVEKIKMQNDMYKALFVGEEDKGDVPTYLMMDPNVNLQSPLNGRVTITSSFGERDGSTHKGIDVISSDKTIYAAGDGVITRANTEVLGGNVIEITHTDSNGKVYITQYGHLNQMLVSVGERVKSGDVIGIMGSTGVVTGPHLHFQMWATSPYKLYNPRNLFSDATNY